MPLDQTANFVRGDVASSIAAGDTTIDVVDASIFPDPTNGEYNCILWDQASYIIPSEDPDVEIVRVTGRDTTNDTLTVSRAQEGTSDVSHPSDTEVVHGPTAKMFDDITALDASEFSGASGQDEQVLTSDGSNANWEKRGVTDTAAKRFAIAAHNIKTS